jgi:predicted Zn finger-like uncharacterized protein
MPSANQQAIVVACPGCGAQYQVSAASAGKRGRCAKCGNTFTVPAASKPAPGKSAFPDADDDQIPQYIPVECHLCSTLMYGGPDQIGKPLKCPDCGARTVVPEPVKKKAKDIPAALEGDQYELWDPDVRSNEVATNQPTYIAVSCAKCDTMMYATEKQIGQTITCPDCGRKTAVERPAPQKPKRSVIASDADTPILDPAFAPAEQLNAITPEMRRRIYEEERNSDYGRALEKSRRTGKRMEVDVRGRPILPRWPLITGVLPFLVSRDVPIRLLAVGLGFFSTLSIAIYGIEMAMQGGIAAIGGMCLFALGCALTMVCASFAFSCFFTIVADSSEGVNQIESWPGLLDWFGGLLTFVVAGTMCTFPGYVIAQFVDHQQLLPSLLISLCPVIFFPIVILSQLDIGSIWGILSPRVLQSVFRCPFSWLTFWVESFAIVAGTIVAGWYVGKAGYNPLFVLVPLGTIGLFLYARLLGRLAWRLAEAMPEPR